MFRHIMSKITRKSIILLAGVLLITAVAVGAFVFQSVQPSHAAGSLCPPEIGYGANDNSSYGWVHILQGDLNSKENAGLRVDGIYGNLTKQAVYNWQRYHAFPNDPSQWDGITGPFTWHSLGECHKTPGF